MFDCAGACGHYAADPYHATGSFVFVIRTSAPTPVWWRWPVACFVTASWTKTCGV